MVIEGGKQKQLDREIRDMISALTSRLSNLQEKPGGGDDNDDDGVKIITIAGSNVGATLRNEVDEKGEAKGEDHDHDHDVLGSLVNSNFQAINNSIMMGGSYSSNDPGVHMDIVTDYIQPHATHHNKRGKRGKKKEMEESTTSTPYSKEMEESTTSPPYSN